MAYDYRQKCLSVKANECECCGSHESLLVHHIDGDRSNDDIDNLTPLCRDCHTKVHTKSHDHEGRILELHEQLPADTMIGWKPEGQSSGGIRTDVDMDRGSDLHNRIKAYAKEHYVRLPRAYAELIERGLQQYEQEDDTT